MDFYFLVLSDDAHSFTRLEEIVVRSDQNRQIMHMSIELGDRTETEMITVAWLMNYLSEAQLVFSDAGLVHVLWSIRSSTIDVWSRWPRHAAPGRMGLVSV